MFNRKFGTTFAKDKQSNNHLIVENECFIFNETIHYNVQTVIIFLDYLHINDYLCIHLFHLFNHFLHC